MQARTRALPSRRPGNPSSVPRSYAPAFHRAEDRAWLVKCARGAGVGVECVSCASNLHLTCARLASAVVVPSLAGGSRLRNRTAEERRACMQGIIEVARLDQSYSHAKLRGNGPRRSAMRLRTTSHCRLTARSLVLAVAGVRTAAPPLPRPRSCPEHHGCKEHWLPNRDISTSAPTASSGKMTGMTRWVSTNEARAGARSSLQFGLVATSAQTMRH